MRQVGALLFVFTLEKRKNIYLGKITLKIFLIKKIKARRCELLFACWWR